MATLLSLPTELLLPICQLLCPHCIPVEEFIEGKRDSPSNRLLIGALSRLARTCTTMRRHAQPILYHCPIPHGIVSLAQTLSQRQDLAQNVQQMFLGSELAGQGLSPSDIVFFDQMITQYPRDANEELIRISPNWSIIDRPFQASDEKEKFAYDPRGLVLALIATQIPNIARLTVETYYNLEFPFCQAASLPYLTHLSLRHGDTELGSDIERVKGILAAAPALKVFRGYMIQAASSGIKHQGLAEVILRRTTLESEAFEAIMGGFEKLETFLYESGGGNINETEATPAEVCRAMLLRSDTLRHAAINFAESEYGLAHNFGDEDMMVSTSLKGMQVLETLKLESWIMYDDNSGRVTGGTLLTQFLPSSIRELAIDYPVDIINDILKLAEEAPDGFPKLEKVRFDGLEQDDRDTVEAAFVASGIQCVFGDGLFLKESRYDWV
ncbi:hypothetical protein EDB80DRAFT_714794 [Ilyonectria destructans]|nr:hypothetical protein EDB80DRAFT_714794 [Ilyonectria destructans]